MAKQWTFKYFTMTKIKPTLKRLHSPDVFDLKKPLLDEGNPFCVLVQAMFGPENADGEESFDVMVCNQKWVEQKTAEGYFSSRYHLVVTHFDITEIEAYLESSAKECVGESWDEVAKKLGKIGKWEFEDYVEHNKT